MISLIFIIILLYNAFFSISPTILIRNVSTFSLSKKLSLIFLSFQCLITNYLTDQLLVLSFLFSGGTVLGFIVTVTITLLARDPGRAGHGRQLRAQARQSLSAASQPANLAHPSDVSARSNGEVGVCVVLRSSPQHHIWLLCSFSVNIRQSLQRHVILNYVRYLLYCHRCVG